MASDDSRRGLTRRQFLGEAGRLGAAFAAVPLLGKTFAAGPQAATSSAGPKRPNIVYFMTDDQAWGAMGCAGNKVVQTPNMDRLAKEGVRLTSMFVTNALCSPSRATFLTGKYSHVTGMKTNGGKLADQPLFLDYLRKAGYHTCFIGKTHQCTDVIKSHVDVFLGFPGQGVYRDQSLPDFTGKTVKEQGDNTDILISRAVEYLQKHRKEPFCLLVWLKAPHRPWTPDERFAGLYKDAEIPTPATFKDDYSGRPQAIRNTKMQVEDAKPKAGYPEWVRDYYRTIAGVDEGIGKVLKVLDDLKLAEDTVVVHTSDNGFFLGEHHFFDKRLMYEPSIRIPMLVRYPRLMPTGGRTISQMCINTDLAPTLLDLAGVEVPKDMQGLSWKPLLEGKQVPWRESWYYAYYEHPSEHMVQPHRGVRTTQWKYIEYLPFEAKTRDGGQIKAPAEYELYNLQDDPDEMKNLYADPKYAEKVVELKKELERLRKELGDKD